MGNWLQHRWGAAVVIVGWGKTLLGRGIFLEVCLLLLLYRVRQRLHRLVGQSASQATKLQLVVVTVSCCRFFYRTELSMYSILDWRLLSWQVRDIVFHPNWRETASSFIIAAESVCGPEFTGSSRGRHQP